MVDIISKRDGPRREDAHARHLIEANRPTITRLADQLSNGAYSAGRTAPPPRPPEASGLIIHTARSTTMTEPPKPFVRIALNGRVSSVDANTGRQLHHLGDLRRRDGVQQFVLATKANGFFSPVAEEIATALSDLDGRTVDRDGEPDLMVDIGARLGLQ